MSSATHLHVWFARTLGMRAARCVSPGPVVPMMRRVCQLNNYSKCRLLHPYHPSALQQLFPARGRLHAAEEAVVVEASTSLAVEEAVAPELPSLGPNS